MLRLQMLPAGPGDCLWLEYGTPPDTRVVIIDGGLRKTAPVLRKRIEAACRERGIEKLEVELLVVTHIDNDHIVGIIELLKDPPECLHVKEIWFNGVRPLKRLPTPAKLKEDESGSAIPPDVLGGDEFGKEAGEFGNLATLPSAADLLGPYQGDQLSDLLESSAIPWNKSWNNGDAVMIPETGELPTRILDGKLKLTILGPTLDRLYNLCTVWKDVLGGEEDTSTTPAHEDLLGPSDKWPPVWIEGEKRDSSFANGSSIMLLAEYPSDEQQHHTLLLAGDAHAPDIDAALKRLSTERKQSSSSFPLDAFKLPHHGSSHNLTEAVMKRVDCSRYLISTDGSGRPRHPDHQALLRILRYSHKRPHLMFNYLGNTTRPWRDSKADVVNSESKDFDVSFPKNPDEGLVLDLE